MSTSEEIHVLILGNAHDQHARHIHSCLTARQVRAHYLDLVDFPGRLRIAYDPVAGDGRFTLPTGETLAFSAVKSVYWRNYNQILHPTYALRQDQAFVAQNDARSLAESVLMDLPTRWVNGWSGFQLHQRKPSAMAKVAALGVRVPKTIVANDPDELLAFGARNPLSIFKPVQGGAHARKLTESHLTRENLETLRLSPVTFQEEVAGTNVRAFVIGDEVLGVEVNTPHLDFRDDKKPDIRACALPDGVKSDAIRIARRLDLLWTGIDFRRTPEGEHVYLEANPSPMFLGFEAVTGLKLSEKLVDLLVA